jgi:PAS domain-containing protein
MLPLERLWQSQNRTPVLAISGIIILAIAVVDWWTKPYVSLGFLYLFPIMFAAAFLPRWFVALLGIVCAALAEVFSSLDPSFVRLTFEALALAGCGLFVGELVRNRRLSLESQARLKALVETSPAAIVTVDERGFIELANRAAVELMVPRGGDLIGDPIAAFLPELHHALRWEEAPQFRASCNARVTGATVKRSPPTYGSPHTRKGRRPSWRPSLPTSAKKRRWARRGPWTRKGNRPH